jgi:hypothetical protein
MNGMVFGRIAGKNDSYPVLTMRNGLASAETLL